MNQQQMDVYRYNKYHGKSIPSIPNWNHNLKTLAELPVSGKSYYKYRRSINHRFTKLDVRGRKASL